MAAQTLYLSPAQASSGVTVTIALPSGPVTARIPPIGNGKIVRIKTPQGEKYVRVRVTSPKGRRLTRAIKAFVLFIMFAMGPVFLITGALAPPPDPNAPPNCGSQQMNPSDTCQIYNLDSSTTYTYTQMQQMQTQAGNSGPITVGAILTAVDLAAGVIVLARRRSSRKGPVRVLANQHDAGPVGPQN